MRTTRIFQDCELIVGKTIQLDAEAANHLVSVLRLREQTPIILFNGQGGEFQTTIAQIEKRKVFVLIEKFDGIEREPSIQIHLAQSISRNDKMDLIIQKAVELGVAQITPIITERCNTKLSQDRWMKRLLHWRKIIISACEQCGRNKLPQLNDITEITDYLSNESAPTRFIFHHQAEASLPFFDETPHSFSLLIGPEGGFTQEEIASAIKHQFMGIKLGPRILRTETAGMTAIASLQSKYGDFL